MSCGVVQRLGVANVDEDTARAGVRALFREVAITGGRSGGEGAGAAADLGMVHYLSACATTGRPPAGRAALSVAFAASSLLGSPWDGPGPDKR